MEGMQGTWRAAACCGCPEASKQVSCTGRACAHRSLCSASAQVVDKRGCFPVPPGHTSAEPRLPPCGRQEPEIRADGRYIWPKTPHQHAPGARAPSARVLGPLAVRVGLLRPLWLSVPAYDGANRSCSYQKSDKSRKRAQGRHARALCRGVLCGQRGLRQGRMGEYRCQSNK
jgi:hypothetical protein